MKDIILMDNIYGINIFFDRINNYFYYWDNYKKVTRRSLQVIKDYIGKKFRRE